MIVVSARYQASGLKLLHGTDQPEHPFAAVSIQRNSHQAVPVIDDAVGNFACIEFLDQQTVRERLRDVRRIGLATATGLAVFYVNGSQRTASDPHNFDLATSETVAAGVEILLQIRAQFFPTSDRIYGMKLSVG